MGLTRPAAFVGSLMTMLVELPLFDRACSVRLVPSYFIPQIDGLLYHNVNGEGDIKIFDRVGLVTCRLRFYFLYSLVKNLPVSASTIHPNMTSHRMDNRRPPFKRRLLVVLGDFAVEVEHLF